MLQIFWDRSAYRTPCLSHLELEKNAPEISIRRNFMKFLFEKELNSKFKNYIKKFLEMIRSFSLLIREDISLVQGKIVGLPND